MSPLLNWLTVVDPGAGYTVFRIGPYSVFEVPPKLLIVPGMNGPPSCQVHVPLLFVVVKIG